MPKAATSAVSTAAALRVVALLRLRDADSSAALGESGARISRYKNGASRIDSERKVGPHALRLVRVFQCLTSLAGANGELRRAWTRTHNETRNDVPAAVLLQPGELLRILAYLVESMAPSIELAARG